MVNDSHDGLEYSQRVISTHRNDWFADTTACGATTLATPARELIAPRKVGKGRERDVIEWLVLSRWGLSQGIFLHK